MFSPLIDDLIQALRTLPGVGPKSAQRMALQLLEHNTTGALHLATAIEKAVAGVRRCACCRTLTEHELCRICSSTKRQTRLVCVVESPPDVMAFEQSGVFSGRYFVLHGHLSPIDGIGPTELGLDVLAQQLEDGAIDELVLATNATIEGEATAHYIAEMGKAAQVKVSRLAQGVPMGGELEYLDGGTLAHALNSRTTV